ncbi:MAG TPA: AsmA family protein [Bryobacteraceae bacterium]|nr:AsmA family protein [Bryobacteraceae bacterium]
MKRAAIAAGTVAALLFFAVLAIPFLVDANQFRPALEAKLSQTLGRQVKIGDLRLTILSGSVTASDVSISEDAAFGSTPFLRAESLKASVELMPLMLSRKLNVTGIAIAKPDVDLIQNAEGVWNFSSLGAQAVARPASVAQAPESALASAPGQDLSIADVKLTEGRVTLRRLASKAKPMVFDKTAIEVKNFSASSSSPFSFAASLPAGGSLRIEGLAGPVAAGEAISTPIDAKITLSHLDLAESGALDPGTGLAGLVSIEGGLKANQGVASVQGKLKLEQARLARSGSPAKRPLELDFAVHHDLNKLIGTIERADIHVGGAVASLTGTYNLHTEPPAVSLKLSGSKMPLTELASLLPALNIVLPAGAEIEAGTAEVHLACQGALDRLSTAGTIGIENAMLANYDLASKMKVIEELAGIKAEPQTTIEALSANVQDSPEGTELDNIQIVAPSIGRITGEGTIDASHDLNFKMRVAMRTAAGVAAVLGSNNGIPFTISGTSQNPFFRPDVRTLTSEKLKSAIPSAGAATDLIQGLLGGKKKQK